jgi:hypothetical protein
LRGITNAPSYVILFTFPFQDAPHIYFSHQQLIKSPRRMNKLSFSWYNYTVAVSVCPVRVQPKSARPAPVRQAPPAAGAPFIPDLAIATSFRLLL